MITPLSSRISPADNPPAASAPRSRRGSAASPALRSDAGFGLLEVLISSLLVALIAIATFTGFDVSNRATADQRQHSQADQIAQQWEERLRGVQTSDIAALERKFCVNDQAVEVAASTPCPASVAGSTGTIYTVETTGKFVSDSSSSTSCSSGSSTADYVQTTTTVRWPSMGTRPPVTETSIVTPPISGQLLVQDYNGPNPISGVVVTTTGPKPATTPRVLTTATDGCAIFTTLAAGDYTVSVNQSGYVDKDGNPTYSAGTTITAGSSSNVSLEYDRAGEISASFVNAKTGGEVGGNDTFMAVNPTMTKPRAFGKPGIYSTTVNSGMTLFPFYYRETPLPATYSYTAYAGGCTSNDPAGWGSPTLDKAVDVAPGGHATTTLPMPPVTMKVVNGATTITNGTGSISELETGLPTAIVTPVSGPLCGAAAKRVFTSTPAGSLPHQALPFGRYEVCVSAMIPTAKKYVQIIENKTVNGVALGTINLAATGTGHSAGECP